jgi:predicted RNase H-like HicB family nuclease
MKPYIAFISTDGPVPSVVFPDFPGCISAGRDLEDAKRMAREALSGHVECMIDAGLEIPAPRSLESIEQTWEDWPLWKDSEYTTALITPVLTQGIRVYREPRRSVVLEDVV